MRTWHPPSVEMNSMTDSRRSLPCLVLAGLILSAPGCVRRTIEITSTPTEALVWVNSREVGRTPLSFEFRYDGQYDVRLHHEGYQPMVTSAATDPPLWDLPGPDFIAEIAPFRIDRTVRWHFDLEPETMDDGLRIGRAEQMRVRLDEWDARDPAGRTIKDAETDAPSMPLEDGDLMGPPATFGRPALPPDTAPAEAPVRPPELYPQGGGVQPDR